jgi:hypothetical protein
MRKKLQGHKTERFRTYPSTGNKYLDRLKPLGATANHLFIGHSKSPALSDLEKRNGY